MPGSSFDTEVLLDAVSPDPARAQRAETLIAAGGTISVQVLNEFANVASRQMLASWSDTRTMPTSLRGLLSVRPLTTDVHDNRLAIAERCGRAVYDAMIAAFGLDAGCDTSWSEDLQDGMVPNDRLRVTNPSAAHHR